MFARTKTLWNQTKANLLRTEYNDLLKRMMELDTSVARRAAENAVGTYDALSRKFDGFKGVSVDGKRKIAEELRKEVRKCFDLDMGRGYGLMVVAILLEAESMDGEDAYYTREGLTQFLMAVRNNMKESNSEQNCIELSKLSEGTRNQLSSALEIVAEVLVPQLEMIGDSAEERCRIIASEPFALGYVVSAHMCFFETLGLSQDGKDAALKESLAILFHGEAIGNRILEAAMDQFEEDAYKLGSAAGMEEVLKFIQTKDKPHSLSDRLWML